MRDGREWARTLPLLFALPMLFLLMGLMIRACGSSEVYHEGVPAAVVWTGGGRAR